MVIHIDLSNLSVTREGTRTVGPIDLSLHSSGITAIMGPNGAGKTTLMRSIHGLDRAKGNIACSAVARDQAFVFQTPKMLRRSVLDNLTYPLRLRGLSRADARDQARATAAQLGLEPLLHQDATALSGGEAQKLAIGRALITAPKLMFVDEPCANLDPAATAQVEALLHDVSQGGVTILLATHSKDQAKRLSHHVIMMHHGQIIEHAATADFFTTPRTPAARAYLNGEILT